MTLFCSLCSTLGPWGSFTLASVSLVPSVVLFSWPPDTSLSIYLLIVVKNIKHKIYHLSVFERTAQGRQTHSRRHAATPPSVPGHSTFPD